MMRSIARVRDSLLGMAAVFALALSCPADVDAACRNIGQNCGTTVQEGTGGDGNNYNPSCDGDGNCSDDVEWWFQAPVSGFYTFDASCSNFDTVLALHSTSTANCSNVGSEFVCDDDGGSGNRSRLSNIFLTAGQNVIAVIDGYSDDSFSFFGSTCSGNSGNACLTITGPVGCYVCGNGVLEGPEECENNGGFGNCCLSTTCQWRPSTFECRAGSGDSCDPAEFCTGNSDTCPGNTVTSAGTTCRMGSGDSCDPAEVCTGVAGQACPADNVTPSGTECRAGGGDPNGSGFSCDPAEQCTGVAGQMCPMDNISPAGTVCNPGSGDSCDPTETCPGGSGSVCPPDDFASSSTVCRQGSGDPNSSGHVCDPTEFCPGIADGACPSDTISPAGFVCNAGGGDPNSSGFVCDPDETCSGLSADPCPTDTFSGAGTTCNPGSGDACDPTETCSGAPDTACPADDIAPANTVCRMGSGTPNGGLECDPTEVCSGEADDPCPSDTVLTPGTVCNPGSGDPNDSGFICDPEEVCSGNSLDPCPVDSITSPGTVCNAGDGDPNNSGFFCDPDETCSGAADDPCPSDTIQPAGTVCNPGSGDPNDSGFICDPDETCSGNADEACPTDSFEPANTVCNPGGGDPTFSGFVCDPDELCAGSAGAPCPADTIVPVGTVCRLGLAECDASESCSGVADESCNLNGDHPDGTACYSGDGIPDPHNPPPTTVPLPCNEGECVCQSGRCVGPGQGMLVMNKAKMKISKVSKDSGRALIEGIVADEETEPAVFGGDFRRQLLAGNVAVFIGDAGDFRTSLLIDGCSEGATGTLIRCKSSNLHASFRLTKAAPLIYDMKIELKNLPASETGTGALVPPITAALSQGEDAFYRAERGGSIDVCTVSSSGKSMKCKQPKAFN